MAEGGKKVLEEKMKEIAKKHGLTKNEIFIKEKKGTGEWLYIIINRAGIDKLEREIQTREENPVIIMWEPLVLQKDYVYLRWKVIEDSRCVVDTTGEASNENVSQQGNYLLSMAEKRGRSRAVLKYLGYYDVTKGEDEADEFEKEGKGGKDARTVIKK
jgi:hypothetical protein